MATIKSIKVGETVYDLKAIYDGSGNIIDQTYAKSDTIPTKVSQLENDSNYLTEHQDISGLATKIELENKVDKDLGKGLSEANYTETEKQKLRNIEDNANNYSHPTTSGNKHIPTGGADGQLLSYSEDGTAQWSDSTSKLDSRFAELNQQIVELKSDIERNRDIDLYSYGVEWDITVSSPVLTRIGNPLLHKSLPIQSAYRGCVSNGTTINYYLYSENWNYKEDGVTPSVLDGTDGVVRVHTPKFYGKSGSNGNKRWVRISLVQIDDSWVKIPEMLIDAYRCTVDQSTNKAVSVVNTTANYRGGTNTSSRDTYLEETPCRSDLGKPRTNVSRATMRTYANNAGSELLCYEYYKWIFYWNYVIEYANFNCQAAYNAELTSDGYRQGGLGVGVTTINLDYWWYYNGYCPLTPCGYCNEIGNNTGVKSMTVITPTASGGDPTKTYTFSVPRWRGFDNPSGDIWTNLDGIVIQRAAASESSNVYTSTTEFTDETGTKKVAGIEIVSDGWATAYDLGNTGEIIPSKVGGSESTYMCDYHYGSASYTALRTLRVGGYAFQGSRVGVGYFNSSNTISDVNAYVGFRTLNVI